MKIGICDDNKPYLNFLTDLVQTLLGDTENLIIDALDPYVLSSQIVNKTCPYDILITDIDMGIFNGLDFAKNINELNSSCIIIFISNHLNYATEVYDVSHIYFVLKSEEEIRLPKALEKAIAVYTEQKHNCLTIRYQNIDYIVSIPSITYVESLGRYLFIHDNHKFYKCINSLKSLSTELSDSFVRCHNSYLINMNYIRSISRTNCVLSPEIVIPISQTYSKRFQAAYVQFVSNKLI